MRNRGTIALVSIAATLGTGLAAGAAAQAAPGRATIHGTASPAASRTPRVGSVAGNTSMDFRVIMQLPDQAAADQFAQAVSTPGSAQYGHFLTAAQWEQRFSPTNAQVAEVKSFLSANGFDVTSVSADRLTVEATGDASQVEQAFQTSLSYHRVHGKSLLLEDNNLSVPSDIAGVVEGVSGVSTTLAHPDSTTDAPSSAAASKPSTAPIPQPPGFRVAPPCGTYSGQQTDATLPPFGQGYPANPPWAVCGYTPSQIRSAYNLNNQTDGSGVTVAIVDAYASPTLLSDAQEYATRNDPSHPMANSQFSEIVPNSFNKVKECDASGWFGEQSLDVEAVHAAAPGAKILYVGTKNCDNSLYGGIQDIVDNHLASIITDSWGDNAGDFLETPAARAGVDNLLEMAASTGISVLFSSGDNGDEFTTVGVVSPDYPASSPWVTSVGGTSLAVGSNGQRTGEWGWSTARSFLCNQTMVDEQGCDASQLNTWLPIDLALDGGSGGGTSYDYPQPFYQKGVVPRSLSTVNAGQTGPNGVVGNQPMRVEPDISLDADPATGFLEGETQTFPDGVYYDQYRIGGTSLSSPLFAGVLARVDQQRGSSIGFVNPALYSLSGNSSIQDVLPAGKLDQSRSDYANSIDPSNGFLYTTRIIDYEGPEQACNTTGDCTTRNVALNAKRGYDNMTGLGAPTAGFVKALAGR